VIQADTLDVGAPVSEPKITANAEIVGGFQDSPVTTHVQPVPENGGVYR
jgi:hypothetical protein